MVDVLTAAEGIPVVLAQFDPDPLTRNPFVSLTSAAVSAFLSTVIVGAIVVAVAPEYTERKMDRVTGDPVGSFAYGVVALLALVVAIVALVITIVGILVVIPLAILAGLVWAVGAAIGYLAIAERMIGREEGWLVPLLVAGAINGGLTLTGIGGVVSFRVGAAGFGAILIRIIATLFGIVVDDRSVRALERPFCVPVAVTNRNTPYQGLPGVTSTTGDVLRDRPGGSTCRSPRRRRRGRAWSRRPVRGTRSASRARRTPASLA